MVTTTAMQPFEELVQAIAEQRISDAIHCLERCTEFDITERKVGGGQFTIRGHIVLCTTHPELLRQLLRRTNNDVNFVEQSEEKPSLLHLAAYAGNTEALTKLCDSPDIRICAKTEHACHTALHMSVKGGDPNVVRGILYRAHQLLPLDSFAEFLNEKDNLGMTALHHAAWEGLEDVAVELLRYKDSIDVNAEDSDKFTPLHLASWQNHLEFVNKLLAHRQLNPAAQSRSISLITGGLNVKNRSETGREGKLRKQEEFLSGHADMRGRRTLNGFVPESVCSFRGNFSDTDKNLICPNIRNDGVTPLHCAAFAGHPKIVRALVQAVSAEREQPQTILNVVDDHHMSPLHYAVIRGDVHTVEELSTSLMVRANDEEIGENLTPLDVAILILQAQDKSSRMVRRCYKDIIALLLKRADVKMYKESLYKERQVFVQAASADMVGGVFVASIAFQAWLQPPLGFRPYYEAQYLQGGAAPPGTYESYAAVGQSAGGQVFVIFNNLSFFFAIVTMLTGAGAVLPSQAMIWRGELEHMRTLLIRSSLVFSASIVFALGAFAAAGFASLPPTPEYQWGMIASNGLGGATCLLVLYYYYLRLSRLFRFNDATGGSGSLKKRLVYALKESIGHKSIRIHAPQSSKVF
ncbi:unnamed protein product [Calypogeia fissa]